jgi:hypothetical protein
VRLLPIPPPSRMEEDEKGAEDNIGMLILMRRKREE